MRKVDLSVLVLNYNTRELLRQCLTTVFSSKNGRYNCEIIVVDNDSSDGSQEMVRHDFPKALLAEMPRNVGFAAGNNVGIKKTQGRFILLLNSDTEVKTDTFKVMLDFMESHPEVGAATCKLVLGDGRMDPACHRGFPTPWAALTYFLKLERLFPKSQLFGQYHQGYADMSLPHEIGSPSGAFFLVRRSVIEKVGLLDEDYFMYGEDLDWAFRIKEAGWKIYWVPSTTVLHRKKQSGRANTDPALRRETEKYFHETMGLFYKKHYARRYGWLVTQLVLFGIRLKTI